MIMSNPTIELLFPLLNIKTFFYGAVFSVALTVFLILLYSPSYGHPSPVPCDLPNLETRIRPQKMPRINQFSDGIFVKSRSPFRPLLEGRLLYLLLSKHHPGTTPYTLYEKFHPRLTKEYLLAVARKLEPLQLQRNGGNMLTMTELTDFPRLQQPKKPLRYHPYKYAWELHRFNSKIKKL
jgi:hypothetical protein